MLHTLVKVLQFAMANHYTLQLQAGCAPQKAAKLGQVCTSTSHTPQHSEHLAEVLQKGPLRNVAAMPPPQGHLNVHTSMPVSAKGASMLAQCSCSAST